MSSNVINRNELYDLVRDARLHDFMCGVHDKLMHISDWARDAWVEIEEADGGKGVTIPQMRLCAIQYLADSMKSEIDLLFGLKLTDTPFAALSDLKFSKTRREDNGLDNSGK